MRLRIKTTDGRLERISVPEHSTLGDLQKQVADVFNLAGNDITLSLNKKVRVAPAFSHTPSTGRA